MLGSNREVNCMASRRLFILLTAGSLISAACGGSTAQREALEAQSQNVAAVGNGGAAASGDYSSGDATASLPADAGADASAGTDTGSDPTGGAAAASGGGGSAPGGASTGAAGAGNKT